MLGQLQDAGNTVTLASYLDLLDKAGMIAALPKHHAKELERRRSSPRLMVYDTSLMCAISDKGRDRILSERDLYGCLAIAFVRIRSEAGAWRRFLGFRDLAQLVDTREFSYTA